MKSYSICCYNEKEVQDVLKKLEKQGCLWMSGHKPTRWHGYSLIFPFVLNVDKNRLTKGCGKPLNVIPATEYLGKGKIIIYTNERQVIAKNTATQEKAIAKCHPDDEFDFSIGARLAFDRLMGTSEPIEEKQKYYNGKVVCVESATWETTKGKIYDVIDGWITFDEGRTSTNRYVDIDDINNKLSSKFIEIIE